ncbi:hypothetical protein EDD86DRAFT_191207 [Gorgonomyces haynaldii]|nr:hypothetical protein EDD86DRAFT_191207 [Gorgonomyces haynaldii]
MSFGAKTSAEQVVDHYASEAKGKYVLVTGGNGGLGLETARVLAKQGAIVTILSRGVSNAEKAVETIKKQHPEAQVSYLQLDLADLDSVRKCAQEYIATGKPLNILINNAGIMACPYTKTKNGFESQFGVNHLGHFLFTSLLLPLLEKSGTPEKPSRVIQLSSCAATLFAPKEGILFGDLEGKNYNAWERYGQSKLANGLYAFELAKRTKNVLAVSVHPGVIQETNLSQHLSFSSTLQMLWTVNKTQMHYLFFSKNTGQGAATSVYCALAPIENGKYYEDCQLSTKTHPQHYNEELAKKLWTVSEELVK